MASLPDPDVKAKIWAEITDPNNTESLYMKRAKLAGFYSYEQLDIVEPYFDKFYELIPFMQEKTNPKTFEAFFYGLLPRMKITDSHIVKLVALKQDTPDNQKQFMNILQDGIELLIRSQ